MSNYILSLGSNDGERRDHILGALESLSQSVRVVRASDIYETPALGGGAPYMNCVVKVDSPLSVSELNAQLKRMEADAGRDLLARQQGRVPLDIDIVVADGEVIRQADFGREFFRLGFLAL